MSINELESKCRELRQLQSLIDEAQAEADSIRDAIKAAMGASESMTAGEYKIRMEERDQRQNRHQRAQKGPAGCGGAVHQRNHRAPLLRSMMGVIAAVAGAIQIASWVISLLDAIEKPSVPTPSKARHREP